jgi:hypothetical protein
VRARRLRPQGPSPAAQKVAARSESAAHLIDAQDDLFVRLRSDALGGHPSYRALDPVLRDHKLDAHVEKVCARFYHPSVGRPGLAPGHYFRSSWWLLRKHQQRARDRDDWLTRHSFGPRADKAPPDHSAISGRGG